MLNYWADFAHNKIDLNAWPLFNTQSLTSMDFDLQVGLLKGYNQERCDFFDSIGYSW